MPLRAGRGDRLSARLRLSTDAPFCTLAVYPAVRLLAADGAVLATAHGREPAVVDPPERRAGGAGAVGDDRLSATLDLDVGGARCRPPTTAQLLGPDGAVVASVPLTGPSQDAAPSPGKPCAGAVTLAVSAIGDGSGPPPDPPVSRAGLRLALELPARAQPGATLSFRLHLANPTDVAIPLAPCPTLTLALSFRDAGGEALVGGGGAMNCAQAPADVPAHGEVVFDERATYRGQTPTGPVSVHAGIAGARPTDATTSAA